MRHSKKKERLIPFGGFSKRKKKGFMKEVEFGLTSEGVDRIQISGKARSFKGRKRVATKKMKTVMLQQQQTSLRGRVLL